MDLATLPVSRLIAHRPPMILIDRVVSCDAAEITTSVTIRPSSAFLQESGVPAYVGAEYMAQTVACFNGVRSLNKGAKVRIGYLVSIRRLDLGIDAFPIGCELSVSANQLYDDGEMAAFDCRIMRDDLVVAKARLNVYQPPVGDPAE
ncbi:hypothetical protein [Microbulbifer sp. S227A]|uniref:ApeP family dehydratase n=1 Tax=Microbulbifer sp. S227A TaxID=3415131 RepID=UPI003C7C793F